MSSPRPRIARWKLLLLAFAILFITAVSMMGYTLFQLVHYQIPESYASWTTGYLMVEYLQIHTNQWPRKWDDFQSATNSLCEKGRMYMPLQRLPNYLMIDWQTDPKRLLQAVRSRPNVTIHVVKRLDGSEPLAKWGEDTEPNARILRYLKTTLTASNTATAH